MPSIHDRYEFIKVLGDGTFGVVSLAKDLEKGTMVAIKKMKQDYRTWEECLKLKEVQTLQKLKHTNIVRLIEVIRDEATAKLYFVFEYMKQNLYEMLKQRNKPYPEHTVRNISYQLLQGILFIHRRGYFHRDLKPENILCQGPEIVKIADFGQAREIRSRPPFTDYIATRWYRAPEVQLGSTNYNSPVDIWALACIMAEIYTGQPLFPGKGTVDQIFKICGLLGSPTKATWSDGIALANKMSIRFPTMVPSSIGKFVPNAGEEGRLVMMDMLQWDPRKRPIAMELMKCKYFQAHVATTGHSTRNSITTPETLRGRGGGETVIKGIREERGEALGETKRGGIEAMFLNQRDNNMTQPMISPSPLLRNTDTIIDKLKRSNYEHQQQRKQWDKRQSDSQDSGVASEIQQQSNRSTGVTRPHPPLKEVLTTPIGPPTHTVYPVVPPLFNSVVPKVTTFQRRKDMLPDLDSNNVINRPRPVLPNMETRAQNPFPRRLPEKSENVNFLSNDLPYQHSRLPGIFDKKEAANYYKKSARYSPAVVSGKNSRVGFGSSAPRFNDSSPPVSTIIRPLGRPKGIGGDHGSSSSTFGFMQPPVMPGVQRERGIQRGGEPFLGFMQPSSGARREKGVERERDIHVGGVGRERDIVLGGRNDHTAITSQWNYNNSAAPSQTGLISTELRRARPSVERQAHNITPYIGGGNGALNRTDWTSRYSRRK